MAPPKAVWNTRMWFGVVMLSLVVPLFQILQEIPIRQLDDSDLDTSYNLVDVKAPAVSGPQLRFASWLFARSFLSPFVLRSLLNKNGFHLIRELAASPACKSLPPTHHPAHRVTNTTDMERAREMAEKHSRFLQEGLEIEPKLSNYRSIMDYHHVYQSGKATPSQVMEQIMEGAQRLEHLHMFASFLPDNIREQAKLSDQRWKKGQPLSVWDGVPVAIKDQSPVRGFPMCRGSSQCREDIDQDDYPAQIFRQAGAIIIGMTTMVEGGMSPLGYCVAFDGPFNPFDEDYYPGGSSSGSAVAVATGLVPMALGWDGGGSVRVPASMSGTLGLATTFGRVAYKESAGSTMAKAGPLAATMTDIALSHLLLGQIQPESFAATLIGEAYLPPPHLDTVAIQNQNETVPVGASNLKGTRLGVYWDHFQHTDSEIYEACLEAVRYLESQGAEIVNITIPHLRELHMSHAAKTLTEFGISWEAPFFNPDYNLEASTAITVALGRIVTAVEVLAAEKLRTYGMRILRDLFRGQKLDAIVSPMLGNRVPKPKPGYRGYGESDNALVYKTMRFVPLANLLGLPGLVVPVGYEEATGLPIGFQILGDAWTEHKLIRIGSVLEKSTTRRRPPPRNFFDPLEKYL